MTEDIRSCMLHLDEVQRHLQSNVLETERNDMIYLFKKLGTRLCTSYNTLERTLSVLEFFEDYCVDGFELPAEDKKIFLNGTQKIKDSLNYLMNEIEDAENILYLICPKVTSEENLMYSVVMDSLDQVMKHD